MERKLCFQTTLLENIGPDARQNLTIAPQQVNGKQFFLDRCRVKTNVVLVFRPFSSPVKGDHGFV
jgi:hypothetical protein